MWSAQLVQPVQQVYNQYNMCETSTVGVQPMGACKQYDGCATSGGVQTVWWVCNQWGCANSMMGVQPIGACKQFDGCATNGGRANSIMGIQPMGACKQYDGCATNGGGCNRLGVVQRSTRGSTHYNQTWWKHSKQLYTPWLISMFNLNLLFILWNSILICNMPNLFQCFYKSMHLW